MCVCVNVCCSFFIIGFLGVGNGVHLLASASYFMFVFNMGFC